MDKKDIKQLEALFLSDAPDADHFKTFEEIQEQLQSRKQAYMGISEERKALNFKERYEITNPLYAYERERAREIYDQVGFLAIVLASTFDDILTLGIYNAHKSRDMAVLKNALHTKNRLRYGAILVTSHAYNHSGQFEQVIDAFADCDIELVKDYLPEKFGLADKNSHNFLRVGSNMIMSMLYKNEQWLAESLNLADKFNNQKGSAKNDVLVIKYLMALSREDTGEAGSLLQQIADAYKKTSWLFNFRNPFLKFFGVYVHGLYHIAYFVLPHNKFREICRPEHTVFWKEFDDYTQSSNFEKGKLCMEFKGGIEALNELF